MSKYIYYNATLIGKRNSPRREADTELILTFSPLTGRIYFTSAAVYHFNLEENRVTIVQGKENPTDLFLMIDNDRGFRLTVYRWANYINCKKAVQDILDLIEGDIAENPRRFIVNAAAIAVDGKKVYRLYEKCE